MTMNGRRSLIRLILMTGLTAFLVGSAFAGSEGVCAVTTCGGCADGNSYCTDVPGYGIAGYCSATMSATCVCNVWGSTCPGGGTSCGSPGVYMDCGMQLY
jgi:hypothetical protein